MDVPPEIEEVAARIEQQNGHVRAMSTNIYKQFLEDAIEFRGCYFAFWIWQGIRCLVIYRTDRRPLNVEVWPFLQCLFPDPGPQSPGVTEMAGGDPRVRNFMEGNGLFETESIADKMGTALAQHADDKDEVEQFDFDKTSTAKRLNGRN